jgi:hypothetical protein
MRESKSQNNVPSKYAANLRVLGHMNPKECLVSVETLKEQFLHRSAWYEAQCIKFGEVVRPVRKLKK